MKSRKSVQIAFSGLMTALTVVLLYLGGIIWILAYVMPMLCGLLMIIISRSFGTKTALLVYFTASVLSLFLLTDRECALLYALFFGYYPMIRDYLLRIRPKFLSYFTRLLTFNIALIITECICVYLLHIPLDNDLGKWGIVILLVSANVAFVMYDRLFDMIVILYDKKLKKLLYKYIK